MTGDEPPCSRAHLVPGDSFERSIQPMRAEPINDKKFTRGSVTNFSASWLPQTNALHQPSGKPASCKISTKRRQDSGVLVAGLMMTGQPTAMAGIV